MDPILEVDELSVWVDELGRVLLLARRLGIAIVCSPHLVATWESINRAVKTDVFVGNLGL